jgi:4'-phosphopantetheinyl transferase
MVWYMEVDTPPATVIAEWRVCLDAAEQVQADGFYFDEDRSTYIAAHWLIRNALAAIGGLPPTDWRFVAAKRGKPEIDPALGRPDLRFNLSHTRGLVACAVGLGTTIGIDVETLSRKRPGLDIAHRFFSPSEVAILRGTAQNQQSHTFFRFWTLKEALIKATGEGMHRALNSFSFSLDPASITFHPDNADEAAKWKFIELQPTSRHLLALAVRQSTARPLNLSIRRVSAALGDNSSSVECTL